MDSPPRFTALPALARTVVLATLGASLGALMLSQSAGGPELDTTLLLVVGLLCAAGSLFEVLAPAHYSLQPTLVFYFWAALLLPPWALAPLAVVSFVLGWPTRRHSWYVVVFNVANYLLAGLAAHEVAALAGFDAAAITPGQIGAIALAAVAFVTVNHALIALAATTSRRPVNPSPDGMAIDFALAVTGACLALLWTQWPGTVVLGVGPVALVTAALWVPVLRHRSRFDPKTGLYHAVHFAERFEQLAEAARKREQPLALVMFDLDHLRTVNNRFGHLAGDRLIAGTAATLLEAAGSGGVAARFGGEEFCLLLPDTDSTRATGIAEALRRRVRQLEIAGAASAAFRPSISGGVAAYPEHGDLPELLMDAADRALYDAKLGGRNRVRVALPPGGAGMLALTEGGREPTVATAAPALDFPLVSPEMVAAVRGGAEEPPDDKAPPPHRHLVKWYAALLMAASVAIGMLSDFSPVADQPALLLVLIGLVVALDLIRLDLFERANTSPASLPVLAAASIFGVPGVLLAEAAIVGVRIAQGTRRVKWAFDFGALGLAGAAAAGVFAVLPQEGAGLVAAGVVAALAYYAVNMPLIAVVVGLNSGTSPLQNWREQLAWLAPHYVAFGALAALLVLAEREMGMAAVAVFGIPAAALWLAEKQYVDRSRAGVAELRRSHGELEDANAKLRALLADNERLLSRIHHSYLSTITSLARTIEAKDPYTGGHTERVAELSAAIAEELGLAAEDLRAIEVGAIIHDIGKIGVPDGILLKPGPLTPGERAAMQSHVEMASYIVADLELPTIVKQMVRGHHERYDGAGYPDRLAGEEIPMAARVLAVADAYDAMTSDRPYRSAMDPETALDVISDHAGTQFCPRVTEAFRRCHERRPAATPMEVHAL